MFNTLAAFAFLWAWLSRKCPGQAGPFSSPHWKLALCATGGKQVEPERTKAVTNCRIPHLGWICSAACGVGFDVLDQQSPFSPLSFSPSAFRVCRSHLFLRNWIYLFFLIFLVRGRIVWGIQMSSSCLAHFNHTQELPVVSSLGLCLQLFTALTAMEALCICKECRDGHLQVMASGRTLSFPWYPAVGVGTSSVTMGM